MEKQYSCKICGYPKDEEGISKFIFRNEKQIEEHIKEKHPEVLNGN